jgi:F-type H+-transporting ATPase subunit a
MLIVFPMAARSKDLVPRGLRNAVESVLQALREGVARPSLHEATDRFMPLLWTIFFLILIANLLGALPITPLLTIITGAPSHFGGTATSDISITLGLALCAFLAIHVGGVREQGFVHYVKNFAPHVPWPLLLLLVPLEILAAFVKPFALCIRLFANMIAGHIVLAILLGFSSVLAQGVSGGSIGITVASVLGATAISLLELFVAFLQAYIFTFLTTLFIGMAVHPEH